MGNCCCERKYYRIYYPWMESQNKIGKSDLNNNIGHTLHKSTSKENMKKKSVSTSKKKNETANKNISQNKNKNISNNIISYNNNNVNNNINIYPNNNYILKKQNNNIINNNVNTFPKGTIYEKELNKNFKYLNIFWYDPNNSKDYDNFNKCFENVEFCKGNNLISIINFFKKESISEWIVITPGSKGEELIYNLQNFENIKTFFIFCGNIEYHEQWAKKYKKIYCIASNTEILCQKLIELNKNYFVPNLNYKRDENVLFYKLFNLSENEIQKKFESHSLVVKMMIESEKKEKNIYRNFCIKSLNYLNSNKFGNDFEDKIKENISLFNIGANLLTELRNENNDMFETFRRLIKNLTLISLYFDQYPFLLNLLSSQEIKNLFQEDISHFTPESLMDTFLSLILFSDELYKKILNNECILEEKDKLKKIQISIVRHFFFINKITNLVISIYSKYSQIINFFRDIDFCLKIYIYGYYQLINTERHNFINELLFSLMSSEARYVQYLDYGIQSNKPKNFDQNTLNIINNTLTIKNFIILGDNKFLEKIKSIEKYINYESFQYLNNFDQITYYLEQKKILNARTIIPFFYFLIIEYENLKKNIDNIYKLYFGTGITFLVFIYTEDDQLTKIIKNRFIPLISVVWVLSLNDILNYLSQNLNFINPLDTQISGFILNVKIPKISFEQSPEDIYQDGCFELAETFDVNLIKNNFLIRVGQNIDYINEFRKNIYYVYKEHNALDIFINQNCIYFGWNLYPEILPLNICFVKRFIYMYCREENPSEKSLYRIINDDLRSREPQKIYRYLNILALINKTIEEGSLASYKGKVYRATKLDEKLIMNLIKGRIMVNTTFWSTSKDFKVAENFMINQNFRNTFIICNTIKNNIDTDKEKLNPFNEKEILFLPFTEFIVNEVSFGNEYGRRVYRIELTELGNKNFVNPENMTIKNINKINMKNAVENYCKEKGFDLDSYISNQVMNIDIFGNK